MQVGGPGHAFVEAAPGRALFRQTLLSSGHRHRPALRWRPGLQRPRCIHQKLHRRQRCRVLQRLRRREERRAGGDGDERQLAPAGHHRALVDGVQTLALELAADLGIDHACGLDGGPAVHRQFLQAVLSADVQRIGGLQQALRAARDGRREHRLPQPGLDVHALFAQPLPRQVQAAVARVFADIAGDVGQLHGHTEFGRAGQRRGRPRAHHQRHHHAHRAGHAGTVVLHVGQGFVMAPLGIPQKTFQQAVQRFTRDGEAVHHLAQRTVGIGFAGPPGVDRVEPAAQALHGLVRVAAQVDGIVGQAAVGVQRRGRRPHPRRQHQRSSEERLRAALHQAAQRHGVVAAGAGFDPLCNDRGANVRKLLHAVSPVQVSWQTSAHRARLHQGGCRHPP